MPEEATAEARQNGRVDPYRAYNFKLEVQGVTRGHFTECSGLRMRVHPIRYREGGMVQAVRALPGAVDYGEVALRYGLTQSTDLWNWFMTSVRGQVERRNVSILMLAPDGVSEVLRWNLVDAWPCQWEGAPLDAMGREAAIETLNLVFESLDRA